MRLIYKKYADGTYKVYETDEKGQNERVLDGGMPTDQKARRVPMIVEVNGDDNHINDALDGLRRLQDQLKHKTA